MSESFLDFFATVTLTTFALKISMNNFDSDEKKRVASVKIFDKRDSKKFQVMIWELKVHFSAQRLRCLEV